MKFSICCLIGIFLSHLVFAQSNPTARETLVKFGKVKKGRAVVRFKANFEPKPGEVYILTRRGENAAADSGIDTEHRERLFGIRFDLSSLTDKSGGVSSSRNETNLELKYGWNKGGSEYGPLFAYGFTRMEKTDSSTLLLGGFYDYNFSPNVADVETLWALRLTGGLGQVDSSGQSGASNLTRFTGGAVYKWFGLSGSFAVEFDASYVMEEVSAKGAKTSTSGLRAQIGVQTYF